MEHDQDFSALRNILALRRLEVPMDTEINRFLIEFHRRQRAQLLVPQSAWARLVSWIKEQTEDFRPVPSLSYVSGFASIALMAFLGFSQHTGVTQTGGQYKLTLQMPNSDATLAMVPTSFAHEATPAKADNLTFTPNTAKPGATHFILANTRVAYDATVAF